LLEEIRTDFRELFSTDAILNDKRRVKRKTTTAREPRSPANIGNRADKVYPPHPP